MATQIQPNTLTNLAAAATTTVFTGPGILDGVTVNSVGATSSVVIYDNIAASGTILATINTISAYGNFPYNGLFHTGLTVVVTGTPDITVRWRPY